MIEIHDETQKSLVEDMRYLAGSIWVVTQSMGTAPHPYGHQHKSLLLIREELHKMADILEGDYNDVTQNFRPEPVARKNLNAATNPK